MNDFINILGQEREVEAGDICYHKLYGYGEVLDVYKDEDNRLTVQVRFASGFQYFNYNYFIDIATVFRKTKQYPLCSKCKAHPVENEGEFCFTCQKSGVKPTATVQEKAVGGYFDDEEDDDPTIDEDKIEMGYLEDMDEDEGGTGNHGDDDDFLKHGFSYGDFNK